MRHWRMGTFHGEWRKGASSGGRMKFSKYLQLNNPQLTDALKTPKRVFFPVYFETLVFSFRDVWSNPQFAIRLRDESDGDQLASVAVELSQKGRRRNLQPNLNIGFVIFPVRSHLDSVTHPRFEKASLFIG